MVNDVAECSESCRFYRERKGMLDLCGARGYITVSSGANCIYGFDKEEVKILKSDLEKKIDK